MAGVNSRAAIYTFGAGLARQRSKTSTITVGEQFPTVFYVILSLISLISLIQKYR
jgi:hypothetical protein